MLTSKRFFELEKLENTLVLTPLHGFPQEYSTGIEQACEAIEHYYLANGDLQHVIIDFTNLDDFGSTVLAFFVRLWKRICVRDGRLMVCNVCRRGHKVLETTHLDQIWTIHRSRKEALAAAKQQTSLVTGV